MIEVNNNFSILMGILIFIITTCIGSFLNVVIYRLPNNLSLVKPRSFCPNCGHQIKWYDNIPIISFILLKGKCRNCHSKISVRYLIVELLTGGLSLVLYWRFGVSWMSLFSIICLFCLEIIFFIDLKHYVIPISTIVIIGTLGILLIIIELIGKFCQYQIFQINIPYISDKYQVLGSVFFIVLALLTKLIEKVIKIELIGDGDLLLFVVVSLFIGIVYTVMGIIIASIIALMVEKIILRNKKRRLIPFGPYLSISFLLVIIFGDNMINCYIEFIKKIISFT